MQAAVVTGCTGAVGLGLIDALMKNNVKVIAVVRKDSKRSYRIKESHSLKKVECDLSELDKLPQLVQATGIKPDVFYHFGWDGTFGDCRNDMYIQNMNVKYALDAVNAAAVMGCSAFIGVLHLPSLPVINGSAPAVLLFPATSARSAALRSLRLL